VIVVPEVGDQGNEGIERALDECLLPTQSGHSHEE
jgi:hypothetical protein